MSSADFVILKDIQRSLAIVKQIIDKRNEDSDTLTDVWNTLLDSRRIVLEKLVSSEAFTFADGHASLLQILQKK
jgi:hypothetical protein